MTDICRKGGYYNNFKQNDFIQLCCSEPVIASLTNLSLFVGKTVKDVVSLKVFDAASMIWIYFLFIFCRNIFTFFCRNIFTVNKTINDEYELDATIFSIAHIPNEQLTSNFIVPSIKALYYIYQRPYRICIIFVSHIAFLKMSGRGSMAVVFLRLQSTMSWDIDADRRCVHVLTTCQFIVTDPSARSSVNRCLFLYLPRFIHPVKRAELLSFVQMNPDSCQRQLGSYFESSQFSLTRSSDRLVSTFVPRFSSEGTTFTPLSGFHIPFDNDPLELTRALSVCRESGMCYRRIRYSKIKI